MLVAVDKKTQARIFAMDAERGVAGLVCPFCGERVIAKKGSIIVHHFAHYAGSSCSWRGESEEHMALKLLCAIQIRDRGGCSIVDMEYRVGRNIADVYAEYPNGKKIAIEIQKSSISIENLKLRTNEYARNGVHVLWIVPAQKKFWYKRCRTRVWERWISDLYCGLTIMTQWGNLYAVELYGPDDGTSMRSTDMYGPFKLVNDFKTVNTYERETWNWEEPGRLLLVRKAIFDWDIPYKE